MPEVVYELSLKDGLTGKLHGADHAATHLEGTLTKVGERLLHVAEGFGVSFGMWKGLAFLEKSVETYDSLEQAQSQVEAGLKSTAHAAGVSSEELSKYANDLEKHVKYNVNEIQDLQSLVLTFPAVNKATFEKTTETILDMATRMHRDKNEIAIAIGKALQDPEHQIANMRRYGVNFNDAQTEAIKQLAASGHKAEAQMRILNELNVEFGGSARAAFDADPLAQFNKATYDLEVGLGQVATEILHEATPYLVEFTDKALNLVHWLKENKDSIVDIVKELGELYLAFKAGSLIAASYTALTKGLATAEAGAATATAGLATETTVLAATGGPIALAVTAVAGLVLVYDNLANSIQRAKDVANGFSQSAYTTEAEKLNNLKDFYAKKGWSDTDRSYAVDQEKQELTKKIAYLVHETNGLRAADKSNPFVFGDPGSLFNPSSGLLNKESKKLQEARSQLKALTDYTNAPTDLAKGSKSGGPTGPTIKPETKGAKGNKAVTINIKIDSLVKDLQIKTTNLKESTGKIQEAITQSLMNAVNNSQIIAEH